MVLTDLGGRSFTGPIAKQISSIDISWIVGLFVSGTVYWLLSRSTDVRRKLREAAQEGDGETVIT